MKRALLFFSLVLLLTASTLWSGAAQQQGASADEARFTGKTSALDAAAGGATRRRFEAGARSAWHSHDRGQLIFVEEGRARVQKRGQPLKDLGLHESEYTAPNVPHWHGAAPDQALVQLAASFGGQTNWMEKVTDEEYQGKTKK